MPERFLERFTVGAGFQPCENFCSVIGVQHVPHFGLGFSPVNYGSMIVWVNLHGSFALGLGLIWLIWIGEILSYALPGLAGRPMLDDVDARRRIRTLGMVALLSTGALLINPRGLEILDYVADLLSDAPSQIMGDESIYNVDAVVLTDIIMMAKKRSRPVPVS